MDYGKQLDLFRLPDGTARAGVAPVVGKDSGIISGRFLDPVALQNLQRMLIEREDLSKVDNLNPYFDDLLEMYEGNPEMGGYLSMEDLLDGTRDDLLYAGGGTNIKFDEMFERPGSQVKRAGVNFESQSYPLAGRFVRDIDFTGPAGFFTS